VISRGSLFPVAGPALWGSLARYLRNQDRPCGGLRYRALPAIAPWLRHVVRHANEAAWRRAAPALDPLAAAAFDEHIRVAEAVGARDLIVRRGYLKLYRTEAAFAASALEREILAHHRVGTEIWDEAEIAAAEPALIRRFARGLLVPDSGSIDSPGALLTRYRAAFEARGGRSVVAGVDRLEAGADDVLVGWSGGTLIARQAVLAAGAWSVESGAAARLSLPAGRGAGLPPPLPGPPQPDAARSRTRAAAMCSHRWGDTVRLLTGIELARPQDPGTPVQLARVLPEASGRWRWAIPSTSPGTARGPRPRTDFR
jgi:D-amino-acid dehydrogenase